MGNISSETLYDYQDKLTSHTKNIVDLNNTERKIIKFTPPVEEEKTTEIQTEVSVNTQRYISYYHWKKVIDKIFAMIGLIVLLPLFVTVAILIKLDSKGPILFRQERIGLNSKPFKIYKFRTMHIGTPNIPTESMKDYNAYLTRVGSIIRKLSIDELPQLFNILKGEMSFIGPRPMIREHKYLIQMRELKGIDILLPGISGLAQVNGRDEISEEKKLEHDEAYLKGLGAKMDLSILVKTVKKVVCKEDITL